MPERPAPSVRARQLARELRRLREAAQLTGEASAARLGWSSAKVSRIETARTSVTISDLRRLLGLYSVSGTDVDRLVDLARTSRERGWWENYVGDTPSEFATFLGLEDEASSIRTFSALVIPGLLQTEDYARALLTSLLLMPPREVERLVQVRQIRQNRIKQAGDTPLSLHVILDESTLRRPIGNPEVFRKQLVHLRDTATGRQNVNIQILPHSVGPHSAVTGTFAILAFPRLGDPEVVNLELLDGHLFIEGEKSVYRYALVFDQLIAKALNPTDSLAFIGQVIEDL